MRERVATIQPSSCIECVPSYIPAKRLHNTAELLQYGHDHTTFDSYVRIPRTHLGETSAYSGRSTQRGYLIQSRSPHVDQVASEVVIASGLYAATDNERACS